MMRNAYAASSTWLPSCRYPVYVLVVSHWNPKMTRSIVLPSSSSSSSSCLHKAKYTRIRILLRSHSHNNNSAIPETATHKRLQDCTLVDRLVDVGFVSTPTVDGMPTHVDASTLQDGLLSVYREHVTNRAPRFLGYQTSIHVMLVGDSDESVQKQGVDTGLGLLRVTRSIFNTMCSGTLMVLLICIEAKELWTISTVPQTYPIREKGGYLDTSKSCSAWCQVPDTAMYQLTTTTSDPNSTSLLPIPRATHTPPNARQKTVTVVRLSSLTRHFRLTRQVNPARALNIHWFWKTGCPEDVKNNECKLSDLSGSVDCLCVLLRDFHTQTSTGSRSQQQQKLWYTKVSRTWDAYTTANLNTPVLTVARQLLFGLANRHSPELHTQMVKDWIVLCGCILSSLLEQGDPAVKAFVITTSRTRYAMWDMDHADGTVSVTSLLSSPAGCRLVAKRRVRPVKGRVKLALVPGLALDVTLEILEEQILGEACATGSVLSGVLKRLPKRSIKSLQRVVDTCALYAGSYNHNNNNNNRRKNKNNANDIQDCKKMDIDTFMSNHAGACVTEMVCGSHRLGNDARYRLMSICYPYTTRRTLEKLLCHRLAAQWVVEGNGALKKRELQQRLNTMDCTPCHRNAFMKAYCCHVGRQHSCIYVKGNHPKETLPKQIHIL
jgi:hypothetical protein